MKTNRLVETINMFGDPLFSARAVEYTDGTKIARLILNNKLELKPRYLCSEGESIAHVIPELGNNVVHSSFCLQTIDITDIIVRISITTNGDTLIAMDEVTGIGGNIINIQTYNNGTVPDNIKSIFNIKNVNLTEYIPSIDVPILTTNDDVINVETVETSNTDV